MAKKRKGTKKARATEPKTKKSAKSAKVEKVEKVPKPVLIQGVRVLTPGDRPKAGRSGAIAYLPLARINVVKDFNPRTAIGDIDELEKSIRKSGLLSPLVVRPSSDGKSFDLVAGERRLRAIKSLGKPWTENVAVTIRTDLEDYLEARAVAIAENSEDGRTNLSPIEIGNAAAEMLKKKWSIGKIAAETGIHSRKLQRCIELVEAPDEVRSRVEKGELGMVAALEASKLPDEQREKILSEVGPGATVDSIRRMRKKLEREERAEAVAKGEDKGKTKSGTRREKVVTSWRGAREKQEVLRALCHDFANVEEAEMLTGEWHEVRGAIAALFWDRGDLDSPKLPDVDVGTEENPKEAKKANVAFDALVKAEAELHEPEEAEAVGAA